MPTAIAGSYYSPQARNFAARGVLWSLGLFGLVRLGWFEAHAMLPLTALQARMAVDSFGTPALPIDVTLACSGADAIALCVGAIFAYPARWAMRLAGAAAGTGLILILNTMRIGTLGRAAASGAWFTALHEYLWPALLMLAIAGYVFTWMRFADSRPAPSAPPTQPDPVSTGLTRRFVVWTAVLMVVFTAASPLYLESGAVLALAAFIAHVAGLALGLAGVHALSTGNILWTSRGGFLVTQECVSTPLIPVYFAAVFASHDAWSRRMPALLAAAPLFVSLGVARLLVVALPGTIIGSPLFIVHAFYQLLLGGVVVFIAAFWRHGAGAVMWRRAGAGAALGAVCGYLLAPWYGQILSALNSGIWLEDPQNALALLPAFQLGLFVALWVATFAAFRGRLFVLGIVGLAVSQLAGFAALLFVARHFSMAPHVRDVRAWALAAPLGVFMALATYDRPRH